MEYLETLPFDAQSPIAPLTLPFDTHRASVASQLFIHFLWEMKSEVGRRI